MTLRQGAHDGLRTEGMMSRPYCGPEEHRQAYAHLQRRHAAGELPPILDWTGDVVEGYADILGIKP